MGTQINQGISSASIPDGSVTSADVLDGSIVNADINASAAIAASKLDTAGIAAASALTGTYAAVSNGGGEGYYNIGNSGASKTIDLANGNVQKLTLTADCTLTEPTPTTGKGQSWTLIVVQDSTPRAITWGAAVKWAGGTPTLTQTSGGVDIFSFLTVDGGTTIYGFVAGQAFA